MDVGAPAHQAGALRPSHRQRRATEHSLVEPNPTSTAPASVSKRATDHPGLPPCSSLLPVAPTFPDMARAEPHPETEHNHHQQQPIHSTNPSDARPEERLTGRPS